MVNLRQDYIGILALILVLGACTRAPDSQTELDVATQTSTTTATPTAEAFSTATNAPQPRATSTNTPIPPQPRVCSPLEGFPLEDLSAAVVNPFQPPAPGSDLPHQGVDLADLSPVDRLARPGRPVHAVIPGRVAMVLTDRFPYGHAVLIETPLEALPADWQARIGVPTPAPTLAPHPALTCPDLSAELFDDVPERSYYLLYAHMQVTPEFLLGETIKCGQPLGAIGDSGNALNPHLHLETRVGPAGARFDSMAHYDSSAQPQEMAAYCTWRVSGIFQLVDPMDLLAAPESPPE